MNPGRQESRRVNVSVSSGAGSTVVDKIWSLSRRIRIIPPSESATYTVTLTDGDGQMIFKRTSIVGSFSELDILSLGILYQVAISGATVDGNYTVKFDMH